MNTLKVDTGKIYAYLSNGFMKLYLSWNCVSSTETVDEFFGTFFVSQTDLYTLLHKNN